MGGSGKNFSFFERKSKKKNTIKKNRKVRNGQQQKGKGATNASKRASLGAIASWIPFGPGRSRT